MSAENDGKGPRELRITLPEGTDLAALGRHLAELRASPQSFVMVPEHAGWEPSDIANAYFRGAVAGAVAMRECAALALEERGRSLVADHAGKHSEVRHRVQLCADELDRGAADVRALAVPVLP